MDREKEKIIEYTIIAGIGAALFAAIIAFNDAHAQLGVPESPRTPEDIHTFAGFGAGPTSAPAPSGNRCHAAEECRAHFPGGIRG